MAGYTTSTEVYYCKQLESPSVTHRLAPAPTISISPEIYYANDSIIGYTYNITLNGYANALRKEINSDSVNSGLEHTVQHIGDIRDIFNFNGGNLYIKRDSQTIMVAKGATVKNISFNESQNKWVNYAPYTIELEFNEIDFIGCSNNPQIACNSSFFHTPHQSSSEITSDYLIDIKQFKIKEFSDKWTISIDNQIYENYSSVYNNIFKVTYTLSATGKNYYVEDKLIPAWQQAKLFVQDRLYKQVRGLISGILQITPNNQDGCTPDKSIDQLHQVDNTSPRDGGLLSGFNTVLDSSPNYTIYNEQIDCETSESDGSFSITYNAICKIYNGNLSVAQNSAIHSYTHDINISEDGGSQEVTITASGKIQGLIAGGFIYNNNNDFNLPANGTFIVSLDGNNTKYSNALNYYSSIGNTSDIYNSFKDVLGINKAKLLIKGATSAEYPSPTNFTLDHKFNEGAIEWSATYVKSQEMINNKGYTNISIIRTDPIDIVQEFIVPGRSLGPILQKLNTKTNRRISINIDGASELNKSCSDPSILTENICVSGLPVFNIANFSQLIQESPGWIKTREDYNSNKIDGSYSISLEYICQG